MREILDNARYAPTVGRYKVYLIDEVHMLSKAAFNSMLKTLEEPPEHVRFVLATTDPQKIPVTVLSRCLQFNLKPLPPALIAARLADILAAEGIASRGGRRGAGRARGAAGRCATACRCSTRPSRTATAKCRKPSSARCSARSTASTSTGSPTRWRPGDGAALLAESDALAGARPRVRAGARRAGVAVPPRRRRAGRPGSGRSVRRCRARARVRRGVHAGGRPAHLPDRRAGSRRSGARARRGDRLRDDAAAPAGVRAGARRAVRRGAGAAPGTRAVRACRRTRRSRRGAVRGPVHRDDATRRRACSGAPPPLRRRLRWPLTPRADRPASGGRRRVAGVRRRAQAHGHRRAARRADRIDRGDGQRADARAAGRAQAPRRQGYADKLKFALEQATGRKLQLAFEVAAAIDTSLAATEKRERAEANAKSEAAFRDEPFVRDCSRQFDGAGEDAIPSRRSRGMAARSARSRST